MIIKQLSVFLENESGRLSEVLETLGNERINLIACSLADTSEFGILRMIVSDPDKAREILKNKHFTVNITEVISIATPNTPGALSKALRLLSDEGISVEYLYAFSMGEKSFVVIRPDDPAKAISSLRHHEMELVKASELYKF